MQSFVTLPDDERREILEAAVPALGLPAISIEKDLWVTWTLREMFALPDWGPQLTFKGGTSLSKCWKLIDRFSEDVDVVIDRGYLGFGGDTLSNKRLDKLRDACSERIREALLPSLRARLAAGLPKSAAWSLDLATEEEDPDRQTLMFRYPTVFPGFEWRRTSHVLPSNPLGSHGMWVPTDGYVKPVVRIELGARSDTEPVESPAIQPLLAEAFPDVVRAGSFAVRTVAPRRTFWEKALLVHEETWRPSEKRRKPRMSRHYYDLHGLIERGVAAEALSDEGLLERVVAHRRVFFRHSWMDYDTMRRGSLRLVPLPAQEPDWRKDYEAMRGEMFFGVPPSFDEVLATVRGFEAALNGA